MKWKGHIVLPVSIFLSFCHNSVSVHYLHNQLNRVVPLGPRKLFFAYYLCHTWTLFKLKFSIEMSQVQFAFGSGEKKLVDLKNFKHSLPQSISHTWTF